MEVWKIGTLTREPYQGLTLKVNVMSKVNWNSSNGIVVMDSQSKKSITVFYQYTINFGKSTYQ